MIKLNPYLNFMGKTEEALTFYKSVFGGEFVMLQRFKDLPQMNSLPVADQEKIMHVSLMVGNSVLMATDALESMGHTLTLGNNISLALSVDSKEEADRIYAALMTKGSSAQAMDVAPWGAYFGMVDDNYGIKWMISYDAKYVS